MKLIKVLIDSFYYGVIPKISTVINIILLPIITPYLTPYDYGIWGLVTAYVGIFVAIAPLGLHVHLTNAYFENPKWKLVWGRILSLFIVSGLITSLIYIILLSAALVQIPVKKRLLIGLCSCMPILLFSNSTMASNLFPLKSKPKPLVFRNLIAALCGILVSFITVYYFRKGYWGFVLGSMASSIVAFTLFISPLYGRENIKPIWEHKFRRIKEWLRISFPVIPHTIGFMLLASSGRIIMSIYNISIDDIGIYSNGCVIGDYMTVVSTSLAVALLPQMQINYRCKNYVEFKRLYYLCQSISLVVIFCFSMWMPEIYHILIRNSHFDAAIPVASFICFANALLPFYHFSSAITFIERQTVSLLWLMFIPGLINIVLCLIFVPIHGYKAVMYSTLISYWFQLLVPFISNYHNEKVHIWLGSRLKLVLIVVIASFALISAQIISSLTILVKIVISLLVVVGFITIYIMNASLKRDSENKTNLLK